jgi:hypothetical protein
MIYLPFSKVVLPTPLNVEMSIPSQGMPRILIPEANVNIVSVMSTQARTLRYNTMPANYPNQCFTSAIDITMIKEITMLMNRRICAENQAMIDDQEDFIALSAKLISDLIDREPDTGRLPDVKVRFR